MTKDKIRIGTRTSQLARLQARLVGEALCKQQPLDLEIVPIKTAGDGNQRFGLKGIFTKEIEAALLDGKIDIAVHSTKDLAAHLPDGLLLAGFLPRGDVRDALIANDKKINSISTLPKNATIGTASVRRRSLLASIRPDLQFVNLRGNVPTRIEKINNNKMHATILAFAALQRLNLENVANCILNTQEFLPAPCQAAIAMQIRAEDEKYKKLIDKINCQTTYLEIALERFFLQKLGGSCQTPIAALAQFNKTNMKFNAQILAKDGRTKYNFNGTCKPNMQNIKTLATQASESILQKAGAEFFQQWH